VKRTFYFLLMIVFFIIITNCSKSSPTSPPPLDNTPTVTSVVVDPAMVDVPKGTYKQFSATVNGTNSPSQDVTWSLSSHINGTSISIITGGVLLFVANGETATTLTVTATSDFDRSKSGFATVTVTNDSNVVVTPPSADVVRGSYQQFTATVNGLANPFQAVTWSVNSSTTGTIISNGTLVVSVNEVADILTVTATSVADPSLSGYATVNIINPPPVVTSVVITPSTVNLNSGETYQFSAVVNGTNNPPQTVDWSVTGKTSSATNINASGLLTVGSNETAPVLTITATSTFTSTISGNASANILSEGGTWTVTDLSTWTAAVNGVRNGGNNKYHTINVTSNITIPISGEFTFGSVTGVTVNIQGNSTISSNSNGTLFCIGDQQTVVIKDITLQGSSSSVVKVGFYDITGGITNETSASFRMEGSATITGGGCGVDAGRGTTFIMKDYSVITGMNGYGAAVETYLSTLIMQDNASITNNSCRGVEAHGVFTMQDNASVSNNNTTSASGGGVLVSSGLFTMRDNSKIMNNTITSSTSTSTSIDAKGGGVCVSGGAFVLENGTISGNTVQKVPNILGTCANAFGGGVYAESFTMHNGTISGNTASSGAQAYGGGVCTGTAFYVDPGTFTMNGGVISGNTAISTSSNATTRGGGWYGGDLIKTGGTIYGNDASESLRNMSTNGNGHAVFKDTLVNTTFWRNLTAGPGDNSTDYGFWLND